MKSLKRITYTILFTFAFTMAQNNNGFVLLKMDVDARAAAMAGAFSAVTNDASASFWNPAGLAKAENSSLNIMYNDWLWDLSHSFAAIQFINGDHNLALSFNYFQLPGIEIRQSNTESPTGVVDAFNFVGALSYASSYNDHWNYGVSVKYLFEKYYLVSAPGWAFDLGVQGQNIWENIDVGATIQNVGKMSKLDKESTPLPLLISAGIAYDLYTVLGINLLLAPEVQYINNEKTYFKLGAEYKLFEYLQIRTGIRNGTEELLWSAGFGVKYDAFNLDYAYAPFEYDLGVSNRISLGMVF